MRVLTIVLLLCGVVPVGAATLSTPLALPVVGVAGTGVACTFINVSSMPLTVVVSLLDLDGHVLLTECEPTAPQTAGWINPGPLISLHYVWCSFSFVGPAKALRAAMEIYDANQVPIAVLPAT